MGYILQQVNILSSKLKCYKKKTSHRRVKCPVHHQKHQQWACENENCTMEQCKKLALSVCACVLFIWDPGCTVGRRQAGRGSVMRWAMFCLETLGPAIHVDAISTPTVTDHVHCHRKRYSLMPVASAGLCAVPPSVNLAFKFPRSQSSWASLESAGQTSTIHGGPPHNLQDLDSNLLQTSWYQIPLHNFTGSRALLAAKERPSQYMLLILCVIYISLITY